MIKTGGTAFDPSEANVYFIASNMDRMRHGAPYYDHLLVAVNELKSADDLITIAKWESSGKKLFIDSGIFNLTNEHSRKHGVPMDVALSLAPDEIDGFDKLWDDYLRVVKLVGGQSWGYIELDQGGRENKIKTRARLEAIGLKPVPVYHPLNDGWDYFDYLAQRYDRICFGNVVQADRATRKRLVMTAWERHRKYPHLWIHLLGLTPNEMLNALPINSCDSSSWLAPIRFGGHVESCDGAAFGGLPGDFMYVRGEESGPGPAGSHKACALAAYGVAMKQRNWRNHLRGLGGIGCTLYPGVHV